MQRPAEPLRRLAAVSDARVKGMAAFREEVW